MTYFWVLSTVMLRFLGVYDNCILWAPSIRISGKYSGIMGPLSGFLWIQEFNGKAFGSLRFQKGSRYPCNKHLSPMEESVWIRFGPKYTVCRHLDPVDLGFREGKGSGLRALGFLKTLRACTRPRRGCVGYPGSAPTPARLGCSKLTDDEVQV